MTFKYQPKEPLTKQNVLRHLSEYDLLAYYVQGFKGWGTKMRSNLRSGDKAPSLHFTWKNNRAYISDFGTDFIGKNVWDYLLRYLNLSSNDFMGLLERVRRDFSLPLEPYMGGPITPVKTAAMPVVHGYTPKEASKKDIRYRSRDMMSWDVDKRYWGQYGITKATLDAYNVKAAESWMVISDAGTVTMLCSESSPSYIYIPDKSLNVGGWSRKVLSPYAEPERKWTNTLPMTVSLGLHMLPERGDVLLIETSLKDTMVIHELYKDDDVWATDLFAESVFLADEVLADLSKRFNFIFIHADNDDPGIAAAEKHSAKTGLRWFKNPDSADKRYKDTADMRKNLGAFETKQYIDSEIARLKRRASVRQYTVKPFLTSHAI